MIYGYTRVSTDGQSVGAQVKQFRAAGAEKVLEETASGARRWSCKAIYSPNCRPR
ncbi:MAG: recombinase family protein [Methylocella sp.]